MHSYLMPWPGPHLLWVTVIFLVSDRTDTQSSPAFAQCQHSNTFEATIHSLVTLHLHILHCNALLLHIVSAFTCLDSAIGDVGVVRKCHSYAVCVGAISWRSYGDTVHNHLAALEQGHVLLCTVLQMYPCHRQIVAPCETQQLIYMNTAWLTQLHGCLINLKPN